jgi:hypothetical protein
MIARYETGVGIPHDRTLMDLRRALEEKGIECVFEGAVDVGIHAQRLAVGGDQATKEKKMR